MQTFLDLFFRTSIDWKNKPLTIVVKTGKRRGARKLQKILSICAINDTVTVGYNSTEADAITALENAEFAGVVEGEDNPTLTVGEWTAVDTFDGETVGDYTFEAEVSAPEGYVFADDVDTTVTATVTVEDYTAEVTTVNVDDLSVMEGTTADLTVEVLDQYDNVMEDVALTYASGDEAVFTVDAGTVTAGEYVADANTATVTVTADGVEGTATVTVTEDEVLTAEEDAEAAIAELPALEELTLEDEAAVVEARTLVDDAVALGVAEEDIEGLADLEAAEAKIADLNAAAEVDATIEALSAPAELTFEEKTDVEDARADYDALTEEQQAYVENLTVLEDAEAVYAEAATATEVVDAVAAADVRFVTLTADVGTVEVDTDKEGDVTLNTENGSIIDGDLTVTAPNLTFTNEVSVTGTVTIEDVAASTWNEEAAGNTLVVNATGDTINVNNTVASATFNVPGTVNGASNIENAVIKDNGVEMDENPQSVDTDNSSYDAHVADITSITLAEEAATQAVTGSDIYTVNYKLFDQYGVEVTNSLDNMVTIEGSIDGMAITIDTNTAGKVKIDRAELIQSKLVTLDFVAEDAEGEETATATFKYDFDNEDGPVATSIKEITAEAPVSESKVEVETSDITLTAKVFDQYGSRFEELGDGTSGNEYKLRWQIVSGQGDVVEFSGTNDNVSSNDNDLTNLDQNGTVDINAIGIGTAEFTVFIIENGIKVEKNLTIEVTPKALTGLAADTAEQPADLYNNEEFTVFEVLPVDGDGGNASVLDITKMNVEAVDAAAEDIDVSLVENEDSIFVKATTYTAGEYDIKVTHENPDGDAFEVTETVTTELNPNVASITLEEVAVNELTAGSTVYKEVSFFNKHDEEIEVDNTYTVNVSSSSNIDSTTLYGADADGNVDISNTTGPYKFVGISSGSNTAGETADVTVTSNGKTASISFDIADASEITNIELGQSSISVILDDTLDAETPANDDMIVKTNGDGSGDTYKLIPVTFKDQYGNVMTVSGADYDFSLEAEDDTTVPVVEVFSALADGSDAVDWANNEDEEIKYIAVKAESDGTVDKSQIVNLKVGANDANLTVQDDVLANTELDITVQDARELTTLSTDPTSGSFVVDASKEFIVSASDQYGRDITLTHTDVEMVPANSGEYTAVVSDGDNDHEAKVTITGKTAGSYDAVVFADTVTDNGTKDTDEVSVTIPLTVDEIANSISTLDIQGTVQNTSTSTSYDADNYQVKASSSDVLQFSTKAYNSDGTEVAVSSTDLIYSVESVTAESLTASDVSVNNNELTIDSGTVNDGDKVTVKVASLNGVEDTMQITLGSSGGVAQTGTYYLADASSTDTALSEITLDSEDTLGVREVVLVAIDQYGKEVNVTENAGNVVLGQDNSTYFDKVADSDSIDLTAKAVGTTNLRVFVDGDQEVVVPVTVNQEAVNLRPDPASTVISPDPVTTATDATVTIELNNLAGDPITGLTDADFTLSDNSAGDTVTYGAVAETGTDGTYEFTAQNSVSETVDITITVDGVTLDTTATLDSTQ